jgi:hypothetical protein
VAPLPTANWPFDLQSTLLRLIAQILVQQRVIVTYALAVRFFRPIQRSSNPLLPRIGLIQIKDRIPYRRKKVVSMAERFPDENGFRG